LSRLAVRVRAILAQRRRRRAQIVPGHRLRLLEGWRDIREPRANFRAPHRRVLQILDAGDRLAGAAVRHDAGEALAPEMKALELAARRVVDDGIGFEHGMITWGMCRAPLLRAGFATGITVIGVNALLFQPLRVKAPQERQSEPAAHVRFAPKADKYANVSASLLCATSGCEQPQQQSRYSICSSAINNRLKGTSMSSARAVVRLMLRVNLVGNWIDRSPTGVPRRMRST
jgi:hypothetical protein